jgi:hypothetical protein
MSHDDVRPRLDHVFLTVDAGTFLELQGTPLLFEEKLGRYRIKNATSTLIGPYRTVNISGRNTFIEFFPDNAPPFPGVRLGIVMSFDRPGQSARAQEMFRKQGITFRHELVRRAVEGAAEPQPWYHLVRPDFGADSPFTLFLSEITPEYYDRIGAQRTPDGRQTREEYLAAAMRAPQTGEQYFDDVRRVTLALGAERAERLRTVLSTLGYTCEVARDRLALEGCGATLDVNTCSPGDAEGLRHLELSLTRPFATQPQVLHFGSRSSLELSPGGEARACWTFAPAHAREGN